MEISGEQCGAHLEERLVVRDRLLVGAEHGVLHQVADMLTQKCLLPARQAKGIL